MSRVPPGLKLALFGGFSAASLTFVVELLFRKSLEEAGSFALQLGACGLVGAALVAPPFLRLAPSQAIRALLLATAALALTCVLFGLMNVVKEALRGSQEPFSTLVALPVFALFSLPLSLPIALFAGWYFHRRQNRFGHL